MVGRSRILPVTYFMQPTAITCQSTVLKMFAAYLERYVLRTSQGAASLSVQGIWREVNTGQGRPSKMRNAHANLKWWLEERFPTLRFEQKTVRNEALALEHIVACVDADSPVLASVSHERVKGHIVLVVGYKNYTPQASNQDQRLVVHDPYGAFDPSLASSAWGKRRTVGGASLAEGGELGPGRYVVVPVAAVSRHRVGDARLGNFEFINMA